MARLWVLSIWPPTEYILQVTGLISVLSTVSSRARSSRLCPLEESVKARWRFRWVRGKPPVLLHEASHDWWTALSWSALRSVRPDWILAVDRQDLHSSCASRTRGKWRARGWIRPSCTVEESLVSPEALRESPSLPRHYLRSLLPWAAEDGSLPLTVTMLGLPCHPLQADRQIPVWERYEHSATGEGEYRSAQIQCNTRERLNDEHEYYDSSRSSRQAETESTPSTDVRMASQILRTPPLCSFTHWSCPIEKSFVTSSTLLVCISVVRRERLHTESVRTAICCSDLQVQPLSTCGADSCAAASALHSVDACAYSASDRVAIDCHGNKRPTPGNDLGPLYVCTCA